MNHLTDQQLLRDYAERRSEAAFDEIVRRHVDLVHSAALRMVRDAHLAEDVTQGVFVALARSAPQLTDRPVLSGWLHLTARNLAANVVRSDVRRRTREQEAAVMNELLASGPEAAWEDIEPHLDAALGELNEADHDAVLLRYFEKKSAQEMASLLGISTETAQKRVSRAVERLREFFSKRNVTIGASGLAVLISANAVQSAPVGLAAAISAAAVLAGTTVSTSAAIATTKIIAMTTLQKTIIGTALVAAVGTGVYEAHQASQMREQVQTLRQQQAPLAGQIQELRRERDDATNRLAGLLVENEQMKSNSNENELLKLRGEVGVLQNQVNAANQYLEAIKSLGYAPAQVREYAPTKFPLNMPTVALAYMGYSQPEAALETLLWAFRRGNQQVIMETFRSQQGCNNWKKLLEADSTDQLAKQGASFMNDIGWVDIAKKEIISDNEVLFTIFIVPSSGTANGITRQVDVKKIQDRWQVGDLNSD